MTNTHSKIGQIYKYRHLSRYTLRCPALYKYLCPEAVSASTQRLGHGPSSSFILTVQTTPMHLRACVQFKHSTEIKYDISVETFVNGSVFIYLWYFNCSYRHCHYYYAVPMLCRIDLFLWVKVCVSYSLTVSPAVSSVLTISFVSIFYLVQCFYGVKWPYSAWSHCAGNRLITITAIMAGIYMPMIYSRTRVAVSRH